MTVVKVGLVLVSHSEQLAQGLAEVAGQMAPDVRIWTVGGAADGTLGTDPERIGFVLANAVESNVAGVAVFADLGSAVMAVESLIDLNPGWTGVRLIKAPMVEGAIVAAVSAQQGGSLDQVERAAQDDSRLTGSRPKAKPVRPDRISLAELENPKRFTARATVRNQLGLHARPAALLARAVAATGLPVTINGVDGSSVLQVITLGAAKGTVLELSAAGKGAKAALRDLVALIEGGLGEGGAVSSSG